MCGFQRSDGPRAVAYRQFLDGVVSEVESDTLRQLVWQSSIALVATAFVSIGLGWFIAGRMLRPVHEDLRHRLAPSAMSTSRTASPWRDRPTS